MIGRYRKQPVEITAIQLPADRDPTDEEVVEAQAFLEHADWENDYDGGILIHTLEGNMRADPGDFIIRGVQGEFYPCKPDIFAVCYMPVEAAVG